MENTYKAINIVKTREDEGLSQGRGHKNVKEKMNLNVIQGEKWEQKMDIKKSCLMPEF